MYYATQLADHIQCCLKALLLIGSSLLIYPLQGQDFQLEVHPDYQFSEYLLGTEQGLQGFVIRDFYQDKKGYVWLLANDILQRYNGNSFEAFFKIAKPSNQGHYKIQEDAAGRIWVINIAWRSFGDHHRISVKNLWVLDPNYRIIQSLDEIWQQEGLSFSRESISGLGNSASHGLLFALEDGSIIAPGTKGKVLAKIAFEFPPIGVFEDQEGRLLTASGNTIEVRDHTLKLLETTQVGLPIFKFATNQEGKIWTVISLDGKIMKMNTKPIRAWGDNPNKSLKKIEAIIEKGWIAQPIDTTQMLVGRYDDGEESLELYKIGQEKPLLSYKNTFEIQARFFVDRQKNIWIPTTEGIRVVSVRPKAFTSLLKGQQVSTRGILALNDSLLMVNSYSGNFVVDLQDSLVQHANIGSFLGLCMDQNDQIWLGIYGKEISAILDYERSFKLTEMGLFLEQDNNSQVPLIDTAGNLWLGCFRGLQFCPIENTTVPKACFSVQDSLLGNLSIQYLAEVGGRLWAASSGGLYEINLKTQKVLQSHPHLQEMKITHFLVDGAIIWLTTRHNGLIRWEYGSDDFQQYLLRNNNNHISELCAVYDDRLGSLWCSSNLGLFRVDKKTGTYTLFDEEPDLSHTEFNFYSHAQLPDGRLVFGGLDGLTLVDPKQLQASQTIDSTLQLDLSTVIVRNEHGSRNIKIKKGRPIALIGQKESLEIDCNFLDFRNSRGGRIWYQVEGLNDGWIQMEGSKIQLNRLPYGKFTLRLKGAAFDNLPAIGQQELVIISNKPWYITPWVIGLYLMAALIFIRVVALIRSRSLLRTKLQLEQLVKQRTRELQENRRYIIGQMDELKSLNEYKDKMMAIIGHELRGPLLSLHKLTDKWNFLLKQGDPKKIDALGGMIEKRVNDINVMVDNLLALSLAQKKEDTGGHEVEINLNQLVNARIDALRPEAILKNVQINFMEQQAITLCIQGFLLGTLTRNVISNAIRYSPANAMIEVSVEYFETYPSIYIVDKGVGMPEELIGLLNRNEEMHTASPATKEEGSLGLGLWICSHLLKRLEGKWRFENKDPGTSVRIWFPNANTGRSKNVD